jgi:hypothetical protein
MCGIQRVREREEVIPGRLRRDGGINVRRKYNNQFY